MNVDPVQSGQYDLFGHSALLAHEEAVVPATHISIAEAKSRFSAMVDGVLHHGERFLIERHGRGVAALVSVEELERLEAGQPAARQPAGAMALVGLWHDVPDEEIDTFVADVRATRDQDTGRQVELGA
ncbi:MAG: type II toxin-antitoxin system Phd/YefM family antitoxin [Dehalococcoidia bacterium]